MVFFDTSMDSLIEKHGTTKQKTYNGLYVFNYDPPPPPPQKVIGLQSISNHGHMANPKCL